MLLVQEKAFVPAVWPVDLNTGANPGDYVSMKNYNHLTIVIMVTTQTGTAVVTLLQASSVAGAGEKTLAFTKQWMTGSKWKFKNPTGRFTVGETVTGAGGASGVVAESGANYILVYTVNGTAVVDGETLTGASSTFTAVADGTGTEEDILLEVTVESNTFTIPAVANRTYVIEVDANTLDMDNDFDCVRLHIAQANAAKIGSALYILSEPRYSSEPMPTAIYD